MRGLAETTGCRRRFLLGYFGERLSSPCGNCDRCEQRPTGAAAGAVPGPSRPRTASPTRHDHPFPPGTAVHHPQWGDGEVLTEEENRITVLFASVGYRTLSLPVILEKNLLTAASGQSPTRH
ncbi:DUF3553 domain-containing protein [Streptomyces sp. GTA36]